MDYNEIWYLGINVEKIEIDLSKNNYNFDDDRSDYKLIRRDHIHFRYEILELIGGGSFG